MQIVTEKTATFGTPKPAKPKMMLTPKDLPSKGIHYHINHLRRLWNRGQFPAPINLSARKIVWDEAVVDAWISSKLDQVA